MCQQCQLALFWRPLFLAQRPRLWRMCMTFSTMSLALVLGYPQGQNSSPYSCPWPWRSSPCQVLGHDAILLTLYSLRCSVSVSLIKSLTAKRLSTPNVTSEVRWHQLSSELCSTLTCYIYACGSHGGQYSMRANGELFSKLWSFIIVSFMLYSNVAYIRLF